MKKLQLIFTVTAIVFAGNVFAVDVVTTSASATALNLQGQQQGQLQGQQQGNALNFSGGAGSGIGNNNSQNHVAGTDLSKAVGMAVAPALTTTLTETCMGSTSFGGGFSGGAFSFGTTWRDHACVRRLDAREIHSYGDIQAAKEIMCDSDLVREAFKRVGRPCAEDGGSYVAVSQPVPAPAPVAQAPMPMATDKPVRDDQDAMAQKTKAILDKADADRKVMKEKYGF